jgi:hypothetical protein
VSCILKNLLSDRASLLCVKEGLLLATAEFSTHACVDARRNIVPRTVTFSAVVPSEEWSVAGWVIRDNFGFFFTEG